MAFYWNDLWAEHADIAALVRQSRASEQQKRFLGGLSALEVPAMGFEVSSQAIRRLPQLAMLLITDRPKHFKHILRSRLRDDLSLAGDMEWSDVTSLIHSREYFQPDTWIEWPKPNRDGSRTPAFMLFRRVSQGWSTRALPQLLHKLYNDMSKTHRACILMPSDAWFFSLWQLPLGTLDQIGIDLSGGKPHWKFLFNVKNSADLLDCLKASSQLKEALREAPLQFACASNCDPIAHCGLEVLPRYRKTWSVSGHPTPIPADPDQWPVWPRDPAFLSTKRLLNCIKTSVHIDRTLVGSIDVGIRGGLSHQKLVMDSGNVVNHKVYLGVMLTKPRFSLAELAVDYLCSSQQLWRGFDLAIGTSDVWIPMACATLLKPFSDQYPSLARACAFNLSALDDLLRQGEPVGFGRKTPSDTDSTLWLMRCMAVCGISIPSDLIELVRKYSRLDGVLPTYLDPYVIANFIGYPSDQLNGWCSPHDCVGANLASEPILEGSAEALAFLRARLRESSFVSYWWPLSSMVLCLLPRGCLPRSIVKNVELEDYAPRVKAVIPAEIAERTRSFFSSLFMLRHGNKSEQDKAIGEISMLILRREDFKGLLLMQLPEPNCVDPRTQECWIYDGNREGAVAIDRHGFFAAAMLLSVLNGAELPRSD